jgi:drug/metabolite transporter (DMT)-like permease
VNARQATMLLALAAMWGASFLFIAIAVDDFGAIGVAESRTVLGVGGLALYAVAIGRLPAIRARWRGYLVLGAINAALPFALIAAAELTIPASLAAIVNASAPLFAAIGAALWLGQPLTRRSATGLALGLAGVALVVGLAPINLDSRTLLAIGASLAAAALYAVGGHMAKQRFADVPPLTLSIGQLTGAAVLLIPALAIAPPRHAPGAGPIAAVVALGLVATGVAYLLYFRLIEEIGATGALTVTQLVPVFGVVWAALFRNERITIGMIVGMVIVLAGVLLVTGTDPRRRRSQPPPPPGPPAADRAQHPAPPRAGTPRAAR